MASPVASHSCTFKALINCSVRNKMLKCATQGTMPLLSML